MTNKTTTVSIDFDQETVNQIFSFSAQNDTSVSELVKMSILKIISEQSTKIPSKPNFQKFFANYKAKRNIFQSMTDEEMNDFIVVSKLTSL